MIHVRQTVRMKMLLSSIHLKISHPKRKITLDQCYLPTYDYRVDWDEIKVFDEYRNVQYVIHHVYT